MASKDKPKFRDMDEGEDKNYLTKSRAQLDLEARTEEGAVPDSDLSGRVSVNPNPFGDGEYVGTDPIYQNASTKANAPLAAEEGVEKELLDAYKEEHEVDDEVAAEDYGLGGKAEVAASGTAGRTFKTILPGQEGYDLKKAEEQNGPPLRVYNNDVDDSNEESDDEVTEVPVPGTNLGATTESSDPDNDDASSQAGSRTGNE